MGKLFFIYFFHVALCNRHNKNRAYCAAPAGSTLNGVKMKEDKLVLDATTNTETVNEFFEDYLAARLIKTGKAKGKFHLSGKTLTCYMEALANEKKHQSALEPNRYVSDFART